MHEDRVNGGESRGRPRCALQQKARNWAAAGDVEQARNGTVEIELTVQATPQWPGPSNTPALRVVDNLDPVLRRVPPPSEKAET